MTLQDESRKHVHISSNIISVLGVAHGGQKFAGGGGEKTRETELLYK
jgi:hypothetical protein